MRQQLIFAVAIIALCGAAPLDGAVQIDWAVIGQPGNAPHPTNGRGSVGYVYAISRHEVTNQQYVQFLNSVDPTGGNARSLFHTGMDTDPVGGITRDLAAAAGARYVAKSGRADKPVVYASWWNAARFTNWLHNGQGDASTTESGAYDLSSLSFAEPLPSLQIVRGAGAQYFLPNAEEWRKAAFYDPAKNAGAGGYWQVPTRSDALPNSDDPSSLALPTNSANFYRVDDLFGTVGDGHNDGFAIGGPGYLTDVGAYTLSGSPWGTFDQAGNAAEWVEDLTSSVRGTMGGAFDSTGGFVLGPSPSGSGPNSHAWNVGFRVATLVVPEPTSIGFALITGAAFALRRRRRA